MPVYQCLKHSHLINYDSNPTGSSCRIRVHIMLQAISRHKQELYSFVNHFLTFLFF